MTEQEFDIVDELYFLTDFDTLRSKLDLSEEAIKEVLKSLFQKGWVRCFISDELPEIEDMSLFEKDYKKYKYLASKKGLMAHNSR